MAKKLETNVETPQLEVSDIAILYTLAQQATIKVEAAEAVSTTLNKCKTILGQEKQK